MDHGEDVKGHGQEMLDESLDKTWKGRDKLGVIGGGSTGQSRLVKHRIKGFLYLRSSSLRGVQGHTVYQTVDVGQYTDDTGTTVLSTGGGARYACYMSTEERRSSYNEIGEKKESTQKRKDDPVQTFVCLYNGKRVEFLES